MKGISRQDWLDVKHHYDDGDAEPEELEYVIDAYVKVWATSLEQALERADIAFASLPALHGVEVEVFDAYGIYDAEGEEIRPVG